MSNSSLKLRSSSLGGHVVFVTSKFVTRKFMSSNFYQMISCHKLKKWGIRKCLETKRLNLFLRSWFAAASNILFTSLERSGHFWFSSVPIKYKKYIEKHIKQFQLNASEIEYPFKCRETNLRALMTIMSHNLAVELIHYHQISPSWCVEQKKGRICCPWQRYAPLSSHQVISKCS